MDEDFDDEAYTQAMAHIRQECDAPRPPDWLT